MSRIPDTLVKDSSLPSTPIGFFERMKKERSMVSMTEFPPEAPPTSLVTKVISKQSSESDLPIHKTNTTPNKQPHTTIYQQSSPELSTLLNNNNNNSKDDEDDVIIFKPNKNTNRLTAKRRAWDDYAFLYNREEVRGWLEECFEQAFEEEDLFLALMDGQWLCKLANLIKPGIIKRIHKKNSPPYMKLENINFFLCACLELGVKSDHLFLPTDLYERKNLKKVIYCLLALSIEGGKRGLKHKLNITLFNHDKVRPSNSNSSSNGQSLSSPANGTTVVNVLSTSSSNDNNKSLSSTTTNTESTTNGINDNYATLEDIPLPPTLKMARRKKKPAAIVKPDLQSTPSSSRQPIPSFTNQPSINNDNVSTVQPSPSDIISQQQQQQESPIDNSSALISKENNNPIRSENDNQIVNNSQPIIINSPTTNVQIEQSVVVVENKQITNDSIPSHSLYIKKQDNDIVHEDQVRVDIEEVIVKEIVTKVTTVTTTVETEEINNNFNNSSSTTPLPEPSSSSTSSSSSSSSTNHVLTKEEKDESIVKLDEQQNSKPRGASLTSFIKSKNQFNEKERSPENNNSNSRRASMLSHQRRSVEVSSPVFINQPSPSISFLNQPSSFLSNHRSNSISMSHHEFISNNNNNIINNQEIESKIQQQQQQQQRKDEKVVVVIEQKEPIVHIDQPKEQIIINQQNQDNIIQQEIVVEKVIVEEEKQQIVQVVQQDEDSDEYEEEEEEDEYVQYIQEPSLLESQVMDIMILTKDHADEYDIIVSTDETDLILKQLNEEEEDMEDLIDDEMDTESLSYPSTTSSLESSDIDEDSSKDEKEDVEETQVDEQVGGDEENEEEKEEEEEEPIFQNDKIDILSSSPYSSSPINLEQQFVDAINQHSTQTTTINIEEKVEEQNVEQIEIIDKIVEIEQVVQVTTIEEIVEQQQQFEIESLTQPHSTTQEYNNNITKELLIKSLDDQSTSAEININDYHEKVKDTPKPETESRVVASGQVIDQKEIKVAEKKDLKVQLKNTTSPTSSPLGGSATTPSLSTNNSTLKSTLQSSAKPMTTTTTLSTPTKITTPTTSPTLTRKNVNGTPTSTSPSMSTPTKTMKSNNLIGTPKKNDMVNNSTNLTPKKDTTKITTPVSSPLKSTTTSASISGSIKKPLPKSPLSTTRQPSNNGYSSTTPTTTVITTTTTTHPNTQDDSKVKSMVQQQIRPPSASRLRSPLKAEKKDIHIPQQQDNDVKYTTIVTTTVTTEVKEKPKQPQPLPLPPAGSVKLNHVEMDDEDESMNRFDDLDVDIDLSKDVNNKNSKVEDSTERSPSRMKKDYTYHRSYHTVASHPEYKPMTGDATDKTFAEFLNVTMRKVLPPSIVLPNRIERIAPNKYKWGDTVVNMRCVNNIIVVRVGGGWTTLKDFLIRYNSVIQAADLGRVNDLENENSGEMHRLQIQTSVTDANTGLTKTTQDLRKSPQTTTTTKSGNVIKATKSVLRAGTPLPPPHQQKQQLRAGTPLPFSSPNNSGNSNDIGSGDIEYKMGTHRTSVASGSLRQLTPTNSPSRPPSRLPTPFRPATNSPISSPSKLSSPSTSSSSSSSTTTGITKPTPFSLSSSKSKQPSTLNSSPQSSPSKPTLSSTPTKSSSTGQSKIKSIFSSK